MTNFHPAPPAFALPTPLTPRPSRTPHTTRAVRKPRISRHPAHSTHIPVKSLVPSDHDISTETSTLPKHDSSESDTPPIESPPPSSVISTLVANPLPATAALSSLTLATALLTAHFAHISNAQISSTIYDFVTGPHLVVAVGMGLSAFIQALTGFGFAIVSVGGLTQVPWIAHSSVFNCVQPVAATLGALTGWILVLPEIKKVNFRDIGVLLIASSLATPLGPLVLERFDPSVVLRTIGALIAGFVVFSVTGVSVSKKLGGKSGAWILGALSGALGGAFDMTGPPLVVFAQGARWNAADGEFRRNVLTVISANSTLVVLYDLLTGRLNDFYYFDFVAYALPTTVIGIVVGKYLASRMDATTFKRVVLATCLFLGSKLLFS